MPELNLLGIHLELNRACSLHVTSHPLEAPSYWELLHEQELTVIGCLGLTSQPVSWQAQACSYNDKVHKADVLDDTVAKIPAKRLPNLDSVADPQI